MKLYLDDEREPPMFDRLTGEVENWTLVKTAEEAIKLIETGQVEFISFDHDLGPGLTGYDVAKRIERLVAEGKIKPPNYALHTGNIVGAGNIDKAMKSAWKIYQSA